MKTSPLITKMKHPTNIDTIHATAIATRIVRKAAHARPHAHDAGVALIVVSHISNAYEKPHHMKNERFMNFK